MDHNFTINQFAIIDENVDDIERLHDGLYWDQNPLMTLSMPMFSFVEIASCIDSQETLQGFRSKVIENLKKMKETGVEQLIEFAKLDRLCFLWASFLDEVIINESSLDTTQWQNNTLVSELFSMRDSGEVFFGLVKKLLKEPKQNLALIQIAYILLQLGFKGRFYNDNSAALSKFIAEVNFVLESFQRNDNKPKALLSSKGTSYEKSILTKGFTLSYFWLAIFISLVFAMFSYDYYVEAEYDFYHKNVIEKIKQTKTKQENNLSAPIFFEDKSFLFQREQWQVTEAVPVSVKPTTIEQKSNSSAAKATTTEINNTTVNQYWVQLGAFSKKSPLVEKINKCNNGTFDIKIEQRNHLQLIGVYAQGYSQAMEIAEYFLQQCKIESYIKDVR